MENVKFQKTMDANGLVTSLEIGGLLILENAQMLKKEFVEIKESLSTKVDITVSEVDEIDISFIQLIAAFLKVMDKMKVKYKVDWKLETEQQQLLENIGLSNDFF